MKKWQIFLEIWWEPGTTIIGAGLSDGMALFSCMHKIAITSENGKNRKNEYLYARLSCFRNRAVCSCTCTWLWKTMDTMWLIGERQSVEPKYKGRYIEACLILLWIIWNLHAGIVAQILQSLLNFEKFSFGCRIARHISFLLLKLVSWLYTPEAWFL